MRPAQPKTGQESHDLSDVHYTELSPSRSFIRLSSPFCPPLPLVYAITALFRVAGLIRLSCEDEELQLSSFYDPQLGSQKASERKIGR